MNFEKSIRIDALAKESAAEFDKVKKRLSDEEENLSRKIGSKSRGGVIGSVLGSLLWLVILCGLCIYARHKFSFFLLIGCVALITVMIMDKLAGLQLLNKAKTQSRNLAQLRERVERGESSVSMNRDAFLAAGAKGWNYPLELSTSAYEEADRISQMIASIQAQQEGLLHHLKNILYYVVSIAFILVAGLWLIPHLDGFVVDLFDDSYPIGYYIAIGVSCLIQIFVAMGFWGGSDDCVTNGTLWSIPVGLLVLGAVAYGGALLIYAVIWIINGIIALISGALSLIAACACLYTFCGGG